MIVHHADPSVGNIIDGLGKQDPLCLLHDTSLKYLRGITILHSHSLLGNNRTFVHPLIHKVYRRSGHLHASLQCLLMHGQAIVAHPAGIREG